MISLNLVNTSVTLLFVIRYLLLLVIFILAGIELIQGELGFSIKHVFCTL